MVAVIYAKSSGEALDEHIEKCLKVFKSIKESFPFIPSIINVNDFWLNLFLSVFFHDFGKIAVGFQKSLFCQRCQNILDLCKCDEKSIFDWNYRHEILSAGIISNLNLPSIILSVATHHYGASYLWENYRTTSEVSKNRWKEKVKEIKPNEKYLLYLFKRLPIWSEKYLGKRIELPSNIVDIDNIKDIFDTLRSVINKNFQTQNVYYDIFLRGLTITCDHISSGGKDSIRKGIKEIHSKLLEKNNFRLRGFQKRTMETDKSVFLCAPTGSGKTEAAIFWCQKNQDAGRRIFYVLPYIASINAMQRELKERFNFNDEDIGILHHKANYFIYKSFLEQKYVHKESLKLMREIVNLNKKLYRPIKILTPYQIIKAFYGVKGFEVNLSEMAGGLFIFDEIHCYEPRAIALIVRCVEELEKIGAKFIFMSATLPEFLYNLFNNKLGSDTAKLSLSERDRQEKELLSQARHRIILIDSEIIDYIDRIKEFLKNKRVLVICNSVGRAQKMYNLLKQSAKKPLLLHGRFITKDRELIEKSISGADLLVGTQAIEVSLNISFDVLFTEPAPLDALLQRFGRVNRFNEANRPVNVYVFKRGSESDEYIYDISRVQRTMGLLSNNLILSNKLAQTLVEETYKEGYSLKEQREYEDTLKDFNWIMDQLPVFDESEFKEEFFELIKSVEVIPIKFQQKYLQLKKDKKFFDCIGYIVPISIKQFCYLNKEGRINKVRNDIFINASYNSELGLDLKKKEVINENII